MARLEKTLLVCSEACDEVERRLVAAGCRVVKVSSGEQAVSHALREIFDAAVIVSTGTGMDLAETVLNLLDIRESMKIIIVSERATFIHSILNVKLLKTIKLVALQELKSLLKVKNSSA